MQREVVGHPSAWGGAWLGRRVERGAGAPVRQQAVQPAAGDAFRLAVVLAEAASVVALLVPAKAEVAAEAVRPKAGAPAGVPWLAGVLLAGVPWLTAVPWLPVLAWRRIPVWLEQAPEPRPRLEAD